MIGLQMPLQDSYMAQIMPNFAMNSFAYACGLHTLTLLAFSALSQYSYCYEILFFVRLQQYDYQIM